MFVDKIMTVLCGRVNLQLICVKFQRFYLCWQNYNYFNFMCVGKITTILILCVLAKSQLFYVCGWNFDFCMGGAEITSIVSVWVKLWWLYVQGWNYDCFKYVGEIFTYCVCGGEMTSISCMWVKLQLLVWVKLDHVLCVGSQAWVSSWGGCPLG